tara:strand:+ start:2339 stop:3622 length:1284 start_codon:yes stop_codon:yes gene_type:complete
MLDIKFIRENPQVVKKDLKRRNAKQMLEWFEDLIKKDEEYRRLLQQNERMRQRRNEVTDDINQLKKKGEDISEKIKEAKEIPLKLKKSDEKVEELKKKIDFYLMRLPNLLDDKVPIGKDENDNVTVRKFGDKPKIDFKLLPHGELLERQGFANFEKAGKVSGNGFYYLMGDAALMEIALQNYAIEFLIKKGFALVEPPLMLRRKPYEGVTDLGDFETMMYKIEDEDLFLIATSEHSIGALMMGQTVDAENLPLKLAGISPCFRKEVGSHSIDTKGIFRVHHFNKIEQFIFCKPEDAEKHHQELLKNSEELFQKLKLPYRVINICSGDIGTVAAKKFDIEAWMPRENLYREVVSCSNCTAYQAVRLGIKYKDDGEKKYVNTLNSTAIATGRALRAILENYQQKDGTVKVPTVLQKYMGKKVIGVPFRK